MKTENDDLATSRPRQLAKGEQDPHHKARGRQQEASAPPSEHSGGVLRQLAETKRELD